MIGSFFAWGDISPYVISYFYHAGETQLSQRSSVLVLPLMIATLAVMNIFVSIAAKYIKSLIGSVAFITVIGSFLLLKANSFRAFAFIYTVFFGLAGSIIYVPPLEAALEWV